MVIENLERLGDDGSTPRDIEHLTCFPNKESAESFLAWAVANGFMLDPQVSATEVDGDVCLLLIHHGRVSIAELSPKTILMMQKSAEFGGEYDGWETEVVKSHE